MKRAVFLFLLVAPILLGSALLYNRKADTPKTSVINEAAILTTIPGSDLKQITLTDKSFERLGIKTVPVKEINVASPSGGKNTLAPLVKKIVPYSSVIYDLRGKTWLYVNSKPLVFIRESIRIDYIDNQSAIVSEGPPTDTEVVTVGVAELYGIETGINK